MLYSNIMFPSTIYRVAAKALVKNKHGDVLVVKEKPDKHWDLPGGGLEHDEDVLSCLRREISEELGIVMHIDSNLKPEIRTFYASGRDIWLLWIIYTIPYQSIFDKYLEDNDYCKFISSKLLDKNHSVEREITKL